MEATILRSEVLRQLDTGEPFSMEFVTADRKRGTGGDLISIKDWQKIKGEAVAAEVKPGEHKRKDVVRDPRHFQHKTVNLFNPHNPRQHPISVHLRLIQFFNGKRVING
jgi:hypothetical protein